MAKTISFLVSAAKYKPFVEVTAEELVFGYDDTLVALAHKFYPRHKRPMSKMGLLVAVSNLLYLQAICGHLTQGRDIHCIRWPRYLLKLVEQMTI